VLALRWTDVDFDAKTISISRSVQVAKVRSGERDPKWVRSVKKPKTARGVRTIQIDDGLCDLLRQERDRHLRLVAGVPDGEAADLAHVRLPVIWVVIGSKRTDVYGVFSRK